MKVNRRILDKKLEAEIKTDIPNSKIEFINISPSKNFKKEFKIQNEKETRTYKVLYDDSKLNLTPMNKQPNPFECYRREIGRVNQPHRLLTTWASNNSPTPVTTVIALPFRSYQQIMISTLKIQDVNTKQFLDFDFDWKFFKDRLDQDPTPPIQLNIKFALEPSQKVAVRLNYTQSLVSVEVLEPDDLRGAYIYPSLCVFEELKQGSKTSENWLRLDQDTKFVDMGILLSRMVTWDNSFAFNTLTFSTLAMKLLFSAFSVWGIAKVITN
jgi:hypothetical protein